MQQPLLLQDGLCWLVEVQAPRKQRSLQRCVAERGAILPRHETIYEDFDVSHAGVQIMFSFSILLSGNTHGM
jgi:hypothetical protein